MILNFLQYKYLLHNYFTIIFLYSQEKDFDKIRQTPTYIAVERLFGPASVS